VRVLIVKMSSMGDVVHALPMVSDIARHFPHARIDWVVEEAFADIPRLHPAVTRVIPVALRRWRRRPLAPASWRQLIEARHAVRRTRYHSVIDCQGLIKSALIAWTARGPSSGPAARSAREPLAALFYRHRIPIDRRLHAVERNRRLGAAALGYALEFDEQFDLRGRAGLLHAEPPFDQSGAVLLFTNASRATKLWPDEYWQALEHALAQRGLSSYLAWGNENEQAACRLRAATMRSAQVLPRASLAQIAALAAKAALVVGLDTGLTHLAAALGAPTVGIFCDYDPALVGLRGGARVASLGGVGTVPEVAQVLDAVDRVLSGGGSDANMIPTA
jgi:heptosyltransferase-1